MALRDYQQEHPTQVSFLLETIKGHQMHHAYLFYGPEGVGKASLAREYGKAIICREKGKDACNSCLFCRRVDSYNHPDLQEILPEDNYLRIDQIRDFQRELFYRPYEADKKVYILQDAHLMREEAQNCLLKTLEEPPDYAVLILITNNRDGLLPTVISRCHQVLFSPLSTEILCRKLREKFDLSEERAFIYSRLSEGSLTRASQLVEEEEVWARREEIVTFFLRLHRSGYTDAFLTLEEMVKKYGERMDEVFRTFLSLFRDLLLLQEGGSDRELINYDYREDLLLLTRDYHQGELERVIRQTEKTHNDLKRHALKQLALESYWLKIRRKG